MFDWNEVLLNVGADFRKKNIEVLLDVSIWERLLAMGVDGYEQDSEIRKHQRDLVLYQEPDVGESL
jgi:hypothetical protein